MANQELINKAIAQDPKETKEFLDAFFGTMAQGIESFADGAQVTDTADFFDEALLWQKGIKGFTESFGNEAKEASADQIHAMFNKYEKDLADAGLNPLLSAAAVTQTKGFYLIYAALKQSQANNEQAPA